MMYHSSKAILVVTLIWSCSALCQGLSSSFYKYGGTEDSILPKAQEAGDVIDLKGKEFVFYGKSHNRLVLYDNGYLGIGGGSPSKTPTVLPFKDSYGGLVAPYWADVDTTTHGAIFYRETEDSGDLADIATDIQGVYEGGFTPDSAVIVTWDAVGYCCLNSDPQTNSFQVVLATDGSESYVIFKYGAIQYTTGDLSGGSNGQGGAEAVAGLNLGDGMEYVMLANSGMPAIIDVESSSNVGVVGVYMFRTDPDVVAAAPFMLYAYGVSAGDTVLPSGSNANSGLVSLTTKAKIYDAVVNDVIVYEDGYISLNGPASVTTPQSFPFSSSYPMIAPFWIDGVRTGDVFYREATDSLLLMRATNEIRFTYGTDFVPTSLFIVTWSGITDGVSSSPNKFQVVIASDGDQSFITFLYDAITWSTSTSGSAQAGMNSGDGTRFFKFPGSGTPILENLDVTSSSGVPGYHVLSSGSAELYPFGDAIMDRNLGKVDFYSIFVFLRKASIPFYGSSYNTLRAYSNGYLVLGGSYGGYCPSAFPVNMPMIAPYWADADTRTGDGGIYFRETSDICQIDRATEEIRSFTGDSTFRPTSLIVATYNKVGYTQMKTDKLNTFQAVVATDGTTSHILYIYKDIQWTSSDNCGGTGGSGGNKLARAGINAGDSVKYTELPNSGSASIVDIDKATNVGRDGYFLLQNTESSDSPQKLARVSDYRSRVNRYGYRRMDSKNAAAMAEEQLDELERLQANAYRQAGSETNNPNYNTHVSDYRSGANQNYDYRRTDPKIAAALAEEQLDKLQRLQANAYRQAGSETNNPRYNTHVSDYRSGANQYDYRRTDPKIAEEQLDKLEHLQPYDYKQAGSETVEYNTRFQNGPSNNPYRARIRY